MSKKFYFIFLVLILFTNFVMALEGTTDAEQVGTLEATVCCEKTNAGLYCQNVPEEECAAGSRTLPSSCESTSFCNPGFCADPIEGTCMDNVPQLVCEDLPGQTGTWFDEQPQQCNLGCCILGDQAAFTTLTACGRLSSFYGLETNYNPEITDQNECLLIASGQEKGACVFEKDGEFGLTCKITTRSECEADKILGDRGSISPTNTNTPAEVSSLTNSLTPTETTTPTEETANAGEDQVLTSPEPGQVEFHRGILCSAETLEGVDCAPSEKTTCLPGKEEVYFVDTCGNPANIYDSNKLKNIPYWTNIIDKSEACNPNDGNENSQSCGNCNYLQGSFCRVADSESANPTYGDYICADLNCFDTVNNVARKHGESWCGYDEEVDFEPKSGFDENLQDSIDDLINQQTTKLGSTKQSALNGLQTGKGVGSSFLNSAGGPVGSRYYRYICNNGDVRVEACADFRQEECIENSIDTSAGEFVEAACRVNRWQDCTSQTKKMDCVNSDVRDCRWYEGAAYILLGGSTEPPADGSATATSGTAPTQGAPATGGAESLSGIGGVIKEIQSGKRDLGGCVPEIPPGLNFWSKQEAAAVCAQANAVCPVTYEKGLIGGDWECVEHCECLPGGELEVQRAQLCMALGDCGPKTNYIGDAGRGDGYTIGKQKVENQDSGGGGLFG